jgi:cell division septal protein FtsQ
MTKVKYYTAGVIVIILLTIFAITRTYNINNFLIFDKIWNKIYKKITYVEIIGNNIIPTEDIVSMLYNTNIRDEFILKNKEQIIESLKKNQMIDDIILKISLPSKLTIAIKEREPLLSYHTPEQKFRYVDTHFHEFETSYLNPQNLIYLRGTYEKNSVEKLITTLKKYHSVYHNLTEIENFAEYRFNIVLNNKLQVLLPEINHEQALATLNKYIVKYNILNKNIYKIDFRSQGKVYIAHSNLITKYKPQPIKIVVYSKDNQHEQYKEMIAKIMTQL